MRAQISQWGNSLAIRIPHQLAHSHGLEVGSAVELIERDDGTLQLCPEGPSLAQLVSGITPDNRHGEVSFGVPEGKEAL